MRPFFGVWLCLLAATLCQARIIYVDDDATGKNEGTSWQNAYKYLQDALMAASAGDEVRVAQGIYRPDEFVLSKRPNLGREETFHLKDGVALKGGYAGLGAPDPNTRDVGVYETILSGDLQGNDLRVMNPADMWGEPTRQDNCQHVVTGSGTDSTAILDGFTVTGGHSSHLGAGMYNNESRPTVIDCSFTWNCAEWGGGMGNRSSDPAVIACRFEQNCAAGGAGVDNVGYSAPMLINCTFTDNFGWWRGGAMLNGYAGYGSAGNPRLTNCIFSGNSTDHYGGAIYNEYSTPTITNCTFSGNTAERGGAIYNYRDSSSVLTNCILWGDTAKIGSEIYLGSYDERQPSALTVSYSNIQGGYDNVSMETGCTLVWGPGNMDTDPRFADLNRGNYHLRSEAWRWDTHRRAWTWDDVTSLCIDGGNPGSPLAGEPLAIPVDPTSKWGQNLRINMGAYGGTLEASIAPDNWVLLADLTNDGILDVTDFAIFSQGWSSREPGEPGDVNRNMKVDYIDLSLLASDWLARASRVESPRPNRASDPFPSDGAVNVDTYTRLRWTPGAKALSHDVYFGTDRMSAAKADRSSAVYKGNQTNSVYHAYLRTSTTYYWRVDEVTPSGTIKGTVWQFTTAGDDGGGHTR